jgi:diguanylate cyclase (GGDEF)-like protein
MTEGGANDALKRDIASEQHSLLAQNVRSSTLPTLLIGALFAGFYTAFDGLLEAWLWWGVLLAVLGGRWFLLRDVSAEAERSPSMPLLYLTMAATGLLWGAAPLLIVWLVGEVAVFTALLLSAGIAIAAFGSYGMDLRATALVTLPIGASIIATSAMSSNPAYYAMGIALPLLYAHQFFVTLQARRVLENQIRLRLENALLIEELSAHAEKTTAELDRRMDTERILRASRDRAERMSATDGMTAISNRRYFDKRLKSEVSRAFRDRTNLSLVISDIDFFKQFNDLYGHQNGDECLKSFARVLESFCRRGGDIAARIGGEEFALLLPTTEHGAAMKLAEQARAGFDDMAVPHAGSKVKGNATASFGVATVMPDALEAGEALLRAADKALYQAKHEGRNRVVSSADVNDDAIAAN